MAKLKLVADPTFKAKVEIPVAGADKPALVEFTFKHRTKSDFDAWRKTLRPVEGEPKEDVDSVLDVASGWDLDEPFTKENVETLVENYPDAALVVLRKYTDELFKARLGN